MPFNLRRDIMSEQNFEAEHEGPAESQPHVTFRVQTPRGLWSMSEPENAKFRPVYPISTKVEKVIVDTRSVFGFVEEDSKYTLFRGKEVLAPERPLASYHIEDCTLLILSVQGGNA
jgi:hypothetical protein